MGNYKLVPVEPTPEMVEAAADAYMPFGDMELALRMAILAAPTVQGEPVGEVRFELGAPSYVYGEICSDAAPRLAPGTKLYAAPQPAPDVSGLVEALERLVGDVERATHVEFGGTPWLKEKMAEIGYARAALAAYRKQEPSHDNQ